MYVNVSVTLLWIRRADTQLEELSCKLIGIIHKHILRITGVHVLQSSALKLLHKTLDTDYRSRAYFETTKDPGKSRLVRVTKDLQPDTTRYHSQVNSKSHC